MRLARAVAGFLVGLLARVWLGTLRVEVLSDQALKASDARPWILAFFHGTQWPMLAWRRRRRTSVLVSLSLDGVLQARALSVVGLSVVRGSSSRGGVRGLARLVRTVREGRGDGAFAVDGPRGPYGIAKGGARVAARSVRGVLVPMGSACERETVFARSWDRFGLAWPFSRVVVCLGAPLDPGDAIGETDLELSRAIESANARAREHLCRNLAVDRRRSPTLRGLVAHQGGAIDRTK